MFNFTVHDYDSRKSTMHIMNTADTNFGPIAMESIFMFWFSKDGEKLTRVEELVDSSAVIEFFARVKGANASKSDA